MSDVDVSRPPASLALWIGVFVVSLVPGLAAFLPGFYRALWNFADPVQQSYLTPARVVLLAFILVAVISPFVGAVACLVVARRRGRSWSHAFKSASIWTFMLGLVAVYAAMVTGGGF